MTLVAFFSKVAFTLEHVFDENAALGDVLVDGELLIVRSY